VRDDGRHRLDNAEDRRPGESFLERFSRRKLEARQTDAPEGPAALADGATPATITDVPPAPEPTDADMPPIESLTIDSDYSGFMSAKVSESLRRAALRKLFHSAELNVVDALDDYAEDFTTFTGLGEIITADMRHQLEVEAKRQAEALRQAVLDGEQQTGEAPPEESAPSALGEGDDTAATDSPLDVNPETRET
jgi:hypothetical protein